MVYLCFKTQDLVLFNYWMYQLLKYNIFYNQGDKGWYKDWHKEFLLSKGTFKLRFPVYGSLLLWRSIAKFFLKLFLCQYFNILQWVF